MVDIDIHRRQARNLAWYDEGESTSNRNPFKKFRYRSMRTPESRAEDGFPREQTEGDTIPRPEWERREEGDNIFSTPYHTDTNPPASSQSVGNVIEMTPAGSTTSAAPLTTTNGEQSHEVPEKSASTKRRFFRNGGNTELAPLEPEDSGKDKQKFTAVGQLKATVLNSWINVLLLMVPVGIAVHHAHIDPIAVFVINFIAIMYVLYFTKRADPLAAMLSYSTEEIALR
ncbi:vacuolar H+/Ca2+ exchanger [Histoplasma capsulatum]|uniref:Vacuolar H+/Ca2+ exchanger n=1 Tax=Ajellomyces capsulatus TaxID=5037 RepID=A0A8A1LY67_AJECA|nr:vacuolar H+/Ca2+ exchanger [Histoplasma capsulatum]